jgi:serine/threonine-protein kinase
VTTERFRRLEQAFGELVALPASQRAAALAELAAEAPDLAAELAALLAADAEASPVIEATVAAGARLLAAGPEVGRRIGRYFLERELGRGGTSTVYFARAGDAAPVALKLLERRGDGAELLRRFENERRILATLDHPGIARLLDVGLTADSRPYVVLEYVQGLPIDAHCDARGLDLAARIRLFREVCAIVHAAHQRLVVHRDLKPSNVLVDAAGAPKLLDFGIARLLDDASQEAPDRTATLFVALTPAYASPEQLARGPVTTATDVWSLGVLLAELLTGHRPFHTEGLPPAEVERIVRQEPPSLSAASGVPGPRTARLPPDLETILRMALRKEPERRYGSVAQLAEDLGRFLDGRPVAARPDTWAYRTATFVRRHRWSVAAAGAFLALLVAFAAATAVQSARIARERDRAERVSSLLVDLFEVSDPTERRGSSVTAREILDRGASRLASELEEEPETRAALQETIGRVYQNLGLFHSAAPPLEQSLATRRRLFPGDHPQVASSLNRLAVVRALAGEYTRAEPLFREALAMRERLLPADDPAVVASVNNLALILHDSGDYAGAERLYRRAIALERRRPPGERDGTAEVNLGLLLVDRGEPAAGAALLRPEVERARKVEGEVSPVYAADLGYLGMALQALGRSAEAERLFRRAIAIDGRAQAGEHVALARDLHLLGALLYERGDLDAAEPLLARAQAIRERLLESGHPELAATLERRARLLAERGDVARAAALAERALAGFRGSLPPGHPSSADALVALAEIRVARGDCAGAALLAREAVAIRAGKLSPADWRTAEARGVLGTALVCAGEDNRGEGERLRAESLVKLSAALPPAHSALRWLGRAPALTAPLGPEARRRSPTR